MRINKLNQSQNFGLSVVPKVVRKLDKYANNSKAKIFSDFPELIKALPNIGSDSTVLKKVGFSQKMSQYKKTNFDKDFFEIVLSFKRPDGKLTKGLASIESETYSTHFPFAQINGEEFSNPIAITPKFKKVVDIQEKKFIHEYIAEQSASNEITKESIANIGKQLKELYPQQENFINKTVDDIYFESKEFQYSELNKLAEELDDFYQ